MKASKKIILDRTIGRILAFLLNLVVFPLGKIFKRNHDDSVESVKVILIAKILGMGSIVRATPLIRALRKKYPKAKHIILTAFKNKELIEHIPIVDGGLYIRDDSFFKIFLDTINVLFKMWHLKIDLYFDLEVYSAFSTVLATLSLARNRYGFYLNSTKFRSGLNTSLIYFNSYKHITEIYLQMARACGIYETNTNKEIEQVSIKDKDLHDLEEYFIKNNLDIEKPFLVINPNASELLLERRWPKEYFILLIEILTKTFDGYIFLVGSPSERKYIESIMNKLNEQARKTTFNTAGKLSLGATFVLIKKAKLMITNDSGLYHIRASFRLPVISLWGPGLPNHYASFPDFWNVIFYSRDVYCSPCLYQTDFPPCRGNNLCMKYISPLEVYKKICEFLNLVPSKETFKIEEEYLKQKNQVLDITIRTVKK